MNIEKQTRNRKMNYHTANNIRFYFKKKDQKNIKNEMVRQSDGTFIEQPIEIFPFSKENLIAKFGITARTFENIINNKVFTKEPIRREYSRKNLTESDQIKIYATYLNLKDGYWKETINGYENVMMDDQEIQIPNVLKEWVEPFKLKHKLVAEVIKEMKTELGKELNYLTVKRTIDKKIKELK